MLDEDALADALVRLLSVLSRATPVPQETALAAAASALYDAGFERVRYHQLVQGPTVASTEPAALYLSWTGGRPHAPVARIGFCIPFADSTFARHRHAAGAMPYPVTDSDYGPRQGTVDRPWVKDLGMAGQSWVDIPVLAKNPSASAPDEFPLRGLLCADWHGPHDELGPGLARHLCLLGHILGGALTGAASPVLARLQDRAAAAARETEDAGDVMKAALACLQDELGVATSSLFEFRWSEQTLRRIAVRSHPSPPPSFSETFLPGSYLTGRAWQEAGYRAVFDFEELCRAEPDLRAGPSYEYHRGAHGPVKSVLFARVATRNPRYMFRLVNNRTHPELPLFAEEAILADFVDALAPLIDARIASRRTAVVSGLLDLIALGSPTETVMKAVGDGMQQVEGVDAFALVAHREGEERPHFFHGLRNPTDLERRNLLKDADYTRIYAMSAKDLHVLELPPTGLLFRLLRLTGETGRAVVAVAVRSGRTRGALLFPVARGTTEDIQASLTRDTEDFLLQIAAACGQAVESDFVRGQTRGALRALSLVGHELGTPLAILANQVESGIDRLTRAVSDPAGHRLPPSYLDDVRKEIAVQRDVMSAVIQLGALVGRQGDGQVVGMRRDVPVWSLINAALHQVRIEIGKGDLLQPSGLYFERPAGRTEVAVSCDYGLVRSALVNLYRNAAKYSSDEPLRPKVHTRVGHIHTGSGDFVEIAITNYGVHIPPHQEDLMFQPFVRLGADEPDVARRGMGLGLYLAKQVAKAHGGSLSLEEHAEEVNDRRRPPHKAVWRTTFRLRLRLGLPIGQYRVTLGQ